jgi:virginiamycin B lyase
MKRILRRLCRIDLLAALAVAAAIGAIAVTALAEGPINEWNTPTANAQPAMITMDTFGRVWYSEPAVNRIARQNLNGDNLQENTCLTANSYPWGIFVESNGRAWFTETYANKIGNRKTDGAMSEDTIPTNDSQPRGVVVDGSTNVWFAEANANKIGKMDQYGNFTEYPVPTGNSQPWGITLDRSGNLWFTERAGNKIGQLTQAGVFTEFQVPTSSSTPTGIALDSSGNIWFTEYDGNKIGMMTPSGVFTEYPIPSIRAKPYWIAVDSGSTVWYTGSGNNSFGRVSSGTVIEFATPNFGGLPFGIATDSDGNVWFTEQAASRIAKASGFAPLPTATPIPPTATPVPPAPTPVPVPHDNRYFPQTGFRIDNDVFLDYFNKRGGIRTFGYPTSRTFTFLGLTTQFYQREIMQIGPSGTAQTMNILDPGLMPYTKINGSTFPGPDSNLAAAAPQAGLADYGTRVQDFVRSYSPDQVEGLNVNFYKTFTNTVTLQDAFPQGGGNAGLLPLLNLELWGVPTSQPSRDPANSNFVYLRFQRGIMHFDATTGVTQGLLLADYLKAIMTGKNLPGDLDAQANGSIFYHQYNNTRFNWVDRPDQLPGTNLAYVFEAQ